MCNLSTQVSKQDKSACDVGRESVVTSQTATGALLLWDPDGRPCHAGRLYKAGHRSRASNCRLVRFPSCINRMSYYAPQVPLKRFLTSHTLQLAEEMAIHRNQSFPHHNLAALAVSAAPFQVLYQPQIHTVSVPTTHSATLCRRRNSATCQPWKTRKSGISFVVHIPSLLTGNHVPLLLIIFDQPLFFPRTASFNEYENRNDFVSGGRKN